MDRSARHTAAIRPHPLLAVMILTAAWTAFPPPAFPEAAGRSDPPAIPTDGAGAQGLALDVAESALGISIYPEAECIALEGPSLEQVDLQRHGWEFSTAEVLLADFLVSGPMKDLRRFYRDLCVRDPFLLLVKADESGNEIVSVRYANRHPLHPRKRWLRIVTYRKPAPRDVHRDGE